MNVRDSVQQAVYCLIRRPVGVLVRLGVRPNHITLLSLAGNAAAAAMIVLAGDSMQPQANPSSIGEGQGGVSLVGWAGIVILLSSTLDMVDGFMARTHHLESRFGAFLDSVTDRYCELLTLAAIALWMSRGEQGYTGAIVAFAALVGSIMVSYCRARAEGLGCDCKVGLMQRPERVVVTAAACIACWATDSSLPMLIGMAVIALAANLTAAWRIWHVRKFLS